jgi:hypothetical protein
MLLMIGRTGMIDAEKFIEERADIPLSQDILLTVAYLEWTLWYLDVESHRQQKMLYMIKVLDMNGLGTEGRKIPIFVPKMKDFLLQMIQTMQKPYCEHDACFVVLNAPYIFRLVWGVVSIILTTKQKGKVMLLGNTSDKKVSDRLLQLIPASMLPRDIGGERQGLQNIYPPTPGSEIPGWISRMSSIQMWPPAPPPAASPSPSSGESTGEPAADSISTSSSSIGKVTSEALAPCAGSSSESTKSGITQIKGVSALTGIEKAGGEAGATLAPPSAERPSIGRLSTGTASTGTAVTESTVRADKAYSTLAVAGDVRAGSECSTLAQVWDVPGIGSPKQQQQCCAIS